ncbi:MAG: rod shape-determining protein MreC, partial [Bacteroidota bacterium]
EFRSGIDQYFGLKDKVKEVSLEYQDLERQLRQTEDELLALKALLSQDSMTQAWADSSLVPQEDSLHYIPARVIRNSIHRSYNYLTINKGSQAGIEAGMGVASTQGMVGKVIRVGEKYSLVQSAINLDFSVPVKVRPPNQPLDPGYLGFFRWTTGPIERAEVRNMPETATGNVEAGYWVVTAGSSTVFPEGIKVGTLIEASLPQPNQGVYQHPLRLAVDFSRLSMVYAIKIPQRAQLDSLEQNIL